MTNYRDCLVRGEPHMVARWHAICDDMERREREWVANLRARGFKAAHPNDGWVNREYRYLTPCYPQFNDGVKAGDLVMLGWHSDPKSWRPVRVAAVLPTMFGDDRWWFDDAATNARTLSPEREREATTDAATKPDAAPDRAVPLTTEEK